MDESGALSRLLGVADRIIDENVSYFEGQRSLETEGDPWEIVRMSSKGSIVLDARMTSYCPNL